MQLIGAFKTRYRLRIKNFVKSYLWKNDFADTIFVSNVLWKSVTRQRQVSPVPVPCFYGSACPRFSGKFAAARYTYMVTGNVLKRVTDSGQRVVQQTGYWVGNEQLPNSEILLLLFTAIEFSLVGSSPYTCKK